MGSSASKAAATADVAGKAATPEAPVRRPRLPGNQMLLRRQTAGTDELPVLYRKCASCAAADSTDGEEASKRVQAKIAVSAPHDPDEQEADAIADRVMRRLGDEATPVPPPTRFGATALRRACATCGVELEEEEETSGPPSTLRRRAVGAAPTASAGVASQITAARGGGQPLPARTRRQMERAFDADFASVRVHTDSRAAGMSRSLSALAFTYGSDLFFDRGRFDPASREGRRLLAHELAHVLQQRPDRLHRQDDDSGKLKGIDLTLIREEEGSSVQITLDFEKKPIVFDGAINSKADLQLGDHPIKAAVTDGNEVRGRSVLFELPESDYPYLWLTVSPDTPEKVEDLKRARAHMLQHGAVMLTWGILDIAGAKDGLAGPAAAAPKFVAAEDWLTKEMIPAVEKLLADKDADQRPEKLIGYVSLPIREKEGPDVSMIQVEKGDAKGKKSIAGHLRVYASRWVGQGTDAQQKYAEETAAAITAKVQAAGKGERLAALAEAQAAANAKQSFPIWAIQLRKQVEAKLEYIRRQNPGRQLADMPDKLFLTMLGGDPFFQIFIEQVASNDSSKLVWNSGIVTPPLNLDHLKDVDRLVRIVREQSALLRQQPVRFSEEKDEDEPSPQIVLMPAIPADIVPQNLSATGATVTGAENEFLMSVLIDRYYPRDALQGSDTAQLLGLNTNDYEWKVERLTADNAAQFVRGPVQPRSQTKPSDVYFDLSNKAIDQPTKIALAHDRIDYQSILADEAYPVVETNSGPDFEFEFPQTEGVYLILCKTTPQAYVDGDGFRHVFPPSRAVFPVRVLKADSLAPEDVNATPDTIQEKERLRTNPKLTEDERDLLDREIAELRSEEKMSHLDLAKKALTDIEGRLSRTRGLKAWMIEDARKHSSESGDADTDPFVVRLLMQDKTYDTKYFGAWQEVYALYGGDASSTKDLELDHTTQEGQRNPLNKYMALLESQRAKASEMIDLVKVESAKFKENTIVRPVATLVAKKTGQTTPLLLLLGEEKDSAPGAYKYKIIDLTLSADKQLFESANHLSVGDVHADRQEAIRSAFKEYGEDNAYPEGDIVYRIAPDTTLYKVANVETAFEFAAKVAIALAVIGLVASVAASGGATTPALALFVAAVSIANAGLALALAGRNIYLRSRRGTLEMDTDMALDVVNVIASLVSLGSLAKLSQLNKAAQAATKAAAFGKAAQITAQVQKIGRMMLLFDVVTLGATAVLTGFKVSDDIARVKRLGLPKVQEDALLRDIAVNAVVQGAMMAFQTVAMARAHIEASRAKIEENSYQSLEERGWIDADGKVTAKAPPFLRAGAKGEAVPMAEAPPVKIEDELPMIREAHEAGKSTKLPDDPDYELAIPITGADGKPHTYYRRRSDRGFCRHSPERYCFITEEDIEAIVAAIGGLDEPRPGQKSKTPSTMPPNSAAALPATTPPTSTSVTQGNQSTMTRQIETVADQAAQIVQQQPGAASYSASTYGTKLHTAARDLFRALAMPKGWSLAAEQELQSFSGLKKETLGLTVEEFLTTARPEFAWLKARIGKKLLKSKIGAIQPDLVLFAPDGTIIVWDLVPGFTPAHFTKTVVYTHIFAEAGLRFQAGETYYRPSRQIRVSPTHQDGFRGTAGQTEGAVVNLTDKEILPLLRDGAGKGKALPADLPTNPEARALLEKHAKMAGKPVSIGDVPLGSHGSAELITGKTTVVGQYFDAKKGAWVDTTNFSIHYTESGLYLRPEAP